MGDDTQDAAKKSHRGRHIAYVAGPLVVIAAAYVGVAAWQSGRVATDTSVGGVQIGGMSRSAAEHKVAAAATSKLATPITIVASGKTMKVQPDDSGISVDAARAVDHLTGFSLDPATLWRHFSGHTARSMPVVVDTPKLQAAIAAAGSSLNGAPVNGTVKFIEGKVVRTDSTPGKGIDAATVAGQIAAQWPARTSYDGIVGEQQPEVTNDEITDYITSFADPAMSGPVTVTVGDHTASLAPDQVSDMLSTVVVGGKLQPKVDQSLLSTTLADATAGFVTAPVNPKLIVATDGTRTTQPGKAGTVIQTANLGQQLITALTSSDRTLALTTTQSQPTMTTSDLSSVGTQLMSQFVSEFPTGSYNAARTSNIRVGLGKINGTVVEPGQTFSLLAALRPFTAGNGYVDAPTLQDGIDVPGMGGGISQVSTTLYNATFFAGLKEVAHTPHAYWIPRYPMGREATLWDPTIDNKFTNDSGHPLVIQAGIEGHAAVIRLYGTKAFTVTSTTSAPFDIVAPGATKHLSGAACIPQPPQNGFHVTVTRVVKNLSGQIVKDESLTTVYVPAVRVICN
ncbi:VanW family protein [Rudaeicoccus suwonensis]|uniref:Vancomycin resistance protein YoaR n=1 Tax=Rudaeicoccus suwonensis TaxID=657409 RepID=A0A561E159_9MICO|nr:VanW family protein [Rudaeicoccus suwonensis]TWE09337.1 vancomycin resistance protein YoaR [Rudaeicoccus suwonensis]